VPCAFYVSLTLDFQIGGKSCGALSCRLVFLTGQDLPVKGKILPGIRKNLPGLNQTKFEKAAKILKRNGAARGFVPAAPPHVFPRVGPGVFIL
jgi:hypothetical protein